MVDINSLQGPLYGVTLIVALFAAFFGIRVVDKMAAKKTAVQGKGRIIFSFLAFGYALFALGELAFYLLFDVFSQFTEADMPDFYWISGTIFMFMGFLIFTISMFKNHGDAKKAGFLFILGIIILGGIIFFVNTIHSTTGNVTESVFLNYYYPIMSALILILSVSALIFMDKVGEYKNIFLYLMVANLGSLIGDILYVIYTNMDNYGLIGIVSDLSYIIAYGLVAIAFMKLVSMIKRIPNQQEQTMHKIKR